MAKLQIDGKAYAVDASKNVLETGLSLGLNLPYFCWHPALGSVGACRQCAVKQFKGTNDTRGKIVMACMTEASDGAILSFSDPEAKAFRASVIEWLMVNHPHDCPVCDEGGECHLQDMTVMTGHAYRRFRLKKRTFKNQNLGPFVNHEMNRCIACYRCVRFYREYAGGHDLNVFAAHDHVYFGRHEDGTLENEFSGNLVEVCPTGVFTDKTLKAHYTRKWDLQTAPSICPHCSLGCNTLPGERYGLLRRIRNRYHEEMNGYFLCDRGRYGYEFVNSDRRIRDVWSRSERAARIDKTTPAQVLERLGGLIQTSTVIGIGSPRASLEANFALRTLVGAERFYAGLSDFDFELVGTIVGVLKQGPVPAASLRDIEHADAVLVLGEDVTQTAPRLALSLRQAVRNVPLEAARNLHIPDWQDVAIRETTQEKTGPLFIAAPYLTKLDEIATESFCLAPDEIARLGFAVAHAIDGRFPGVPDLPSEWLNRAKSIAETLLAAKRPAIVSGTGARSNAVLKAAANVASALHARNSAAKLCFAASEANSLGARLLGGKSLSLAFEQVANDRAETVIVLENDLFRRGEASAVKAALAKAKTVVLLDHTATAMVPRADIILPCATFAESDGTFINNEGRAQRFYRVFVPKPNTSSSWQWIRDLLIASGRAQSHLWANPGANRDAVAADLGKIYPELGAITDASAPSSFRVHGNRIARQPHRYSGRTAIGANLSVHEPKPPEDTDSPFAFSMEGSQQETPPPLLPRYWAPGWNSVQSLNQFQIEVGGPLRGGSGGKRLFAPTPGQASDQVIGFRDIPPAFAPTVGQWLVIPIHHIFGSEELSALSPGISERAPRPYVAMNPEDAARLEAKSGDAVDITVANGAPLRLPVRIEPSLPNCVVGLPVGLPALEGRDVQLPAWGEILK